jgi:hypothetical protein
MMAVALTTPSIGGFAPGRERLSLLGVRGHKAGKPARITPRDLCRVVNPRRQPAAGNGLTRYRIGTHRMTSPLSEPSPYAALGGAASDARTNRGGISRQKAATRRGAAPSPESRIDPLAARAEADHLPRRDLDRGARRGWLLGGFFNRRRKISTGLLLLRRVGGTDPNPASRQTGSDVFLTSTDLV